MQQNTSHQAELPRVLNVQQFAAAREPEVSVAILSARSVALVAATSADAA